MLALLVTSGWREISVAAENDSAADYRAAKIAIQQQLRSKKPDDRIQALRRLEEFPLVDAAKLALGVSARDESTDVRQAALTCVAVMAGSAVVSKFLLD